MAVFDRGDIVRVNLNPVVGHEMSDEARPVRVLTTKVFNRLGDVLVAPIAQGGDFFRYAGFAESLTGASCTTQSAARVNKVRMIWMRVTPEKLNPLRRQSSTMRSFAF